MKMKKTALVISILAGILVLSALIVLAGNSTVNGAAEVKSESIGKTLSSHTPIYIDGNAQFTSANGVSSGSGTEADPYIIENWDINASSANGVDIRNTDAYFIIRNCTIYDGKSNENRGVYFYNVTNGKIDNATSYYNRYGIYLYRSSNNTVTNCAVYNNSGGIDLYYSSNNNIADNQMWDGKINLYVGGSQKQDYNHTISMSNTVNEKPVYYFFDRKDQIIENLDAGHITLAWCDNVTLRNSNSTSGDPIYLPYTINSIVENCNGSNNNYVGISLSSSSNNNIKNNNVSLNSYFGIHLYSSSNNNIKNNTVSLNNIDGIFLDSSSSNIIDHNNLLNNGNGICSFSSNNNIIIGNNISSNNWDGIFLDSSSSNIIDHNSVSDNLRGIRFGSSSNNNITNCNVYNNSYGIYLNYSSNNTITNCSVYNNYYGIRLDSYSNNNWFYHNNFINNAQNAYDPCTNYWDNGIEGNYWDDYTGTDTNCNGIGDTPYSISGGSNQDNYPLMRPCGYVNVQPNPPIILLPANDSWINKICHCLIGISQTQILIAVFMTPRTVLTFK